MQEPKLSRIMLFLYILGICLGLAFIISEIVISYLYLYTTECNKNTIIPPTYWLLTSGLSIPFAFILNITITSCLVFVLHASWVHNFMNYISFLFDTFCIIWPILGAVILFRDNSNCQPQLLYNMLMASVVIRVSNIFIIMYQRWKEAKAHPLASV